MKIRDRIQNMIIWLWLAFMTIASFHYLTVQIGFKPDGFLIGTIACVITDILYNRLKIKENENVTNR